MPLSVIQYRKTNTAFGGENMHHEEENMCCCTNHGRMFLTKEEKLEKLKEYKTWLENESKGVDEAIAKLKSN